MRHRTTPEQRAAARAYYWANREKQLANARSYQAKPENRARLLDQQRKYGSKNRAKIRKRKRDKLEAEMVSEAGRPRPEFCEVCGRSGSGFGRGIAFDHCHKLGHFRGWLCGKCNMILGAADDDPDILRKLIAYLLRTSDYTPPQLTLPGI